jgi:hypothetical protein
MNLEDRLERFFSEQDNLDAIYWLLKGLSYREAGDKIRRPHTFIQRVNNFLKNHGLITGRQWRIDVEAMDMTKTYKFYDYDKEKPNEVIQNNDFLTYFADVKMGESQQLALYTFPNEITDKLGKKISPYFIMIPEFKAPLHICKISIDSFKHAYASENNSNFLPPRGTPLKPDIIHIEIARYVELYGNINLDRGLGGISLPQLIDCIKDDMINEGLNNEIKITYDVVRNRYNEMLEKNIIYQGFGLDMHKIGYELSFCLLKDVEIYRLMKTFAHFNIVSALAYLEDSSYLLHLQYPKEKYPDIVKILNEYDPLNKMFMAIKVHSNRVLPHPFFFKKMKEKLEHKGKYSR